MRMLDIVARETLSCAANLAMMGSNNYGSDCPRGLTWVGSHGPNGRGRFLSLIANGPNGAPYILKHTRA
eukprot:12335250-Alexandrium_andersonii.AAC.1